MAELPGIVAQDKLVPIAQCDKLLVSSPSSPWEMEHKLIRGRVQRVWKNQPATLRDCWLFAAQSFGPRPYIVAEGETHTFAQTHARVVALAHHLVRLGANKGDRIALVARNHVEFIIAFWAIGLIGAVPALVNAFLEGQAMYDCIRDVGCKIALVDVERAQRLNKTGCIQKLFGPAPGTKDDFGCTPGAHQGLSAVVVLPRAFDGIVPKQKREWVAGKYGAKVFDLDELSNAGLPSTPPEVKDLTPEDLGMILFTSGTTGKPKGVCSTQRSFISTVLTSSFGLARAFIRRGIQPPVPGPNDPQPTALLLVPLFHSTGIQSTMVPATLRGSLLGLMPKYTVDAAVSMIQEHKIQTIVGIGFMVREIINSPHKLDSVTAMSFGGSSASKEIPGEFKSKHPKALLGQGYGSTEVNGSATTIAADDFAVRPTSTGIPSAVCEIMVMDPDTNTSVPVDVPGEVWIKGPGVALGYWGKPEATAEAFTPDGWYKSGDIGRLDKDGFLYIMDRSKHIIIRGGENISGTEVEDAIYEEKRIIDCAAVPVPDERLGEKVAVVCIPRPECEQWPTEAEILEKAAKVLPRHAVPEFVWIRKEPLERNANGKVDKAIVKEAVRKRYAQHQAEGLKSKM